MYLWMKWCPGSCCWEKGRWWQKWTLMAKMDIKQAYRNIPVHPTDRYLIGMRWESRIFVDKTLPFGLRWSAPLLFSAVADALAWIMPRSTSSFKYSVTTSGYSWDSLVEVLVCTGRDRTQPWNHLYCPARYSPRRLCLDAQPGAPPTCRATAVRLAGLQAQQLFCVGVWTCMFIWEW